MSRRPDGKSDERFPLTRSKRKNSENVWLEMTTHFDKVSRQAVTRNILFLPTPRNVRTLLWGLSIFFCWSDVLSRYRRAKLQLNIDIENDYQRPCRPYIDYTSGWIDLWMIQVEDSQISELVFLSKWISIANRGEERANVVETKHSKHSRQCKISNLFWERKFFELMNFWWIFETVELLNFTHVTNIEFQS